MANRGEIYVIFQEYEDDPKQGKRRPVVVLDVSDPSNPIVAQISSVTPKTPPVAEDRFKVEIRRWSAAGLKKQSYTRCHRTAAVHISLLRNKLGEMHPIDVNRSIAMVNRIGRYSITP